VLLAADDDIAHRVARVLRELARCGGLHQLAAHAARESHAFALHVGAGRLEQRQRLRVVAEVDADLLQDGVGVVLEQLEAVVAQHFVARDLACDVRHEIMRPRRARGALGIAPTRAAAACIGAAGLVHDGQYGRGLGARLIRLRH
jgi:hypothetical protein